MIKGLLILATNTKIKPGDIGFSGYIANADNATLGLVLNLVYLIAGIVGVLILIFAGFRFVTSQGDANQIAAAKKTILGTVIGLVIIMMAFVITQYLLGVLQ